MQVNSFYTGNIEKMPELIVIGFFRKKERPCVLFSKGKNDHITFRLLQKDTLLFVRKTILF